MQHGFFSNFTVIFLAVAALALLAAIVLAYQADRRRAKTPKRGTPAPSIKSQWVPRTSCCCLLVGYITGLALFIWLTRPGREMAILVDTFWEGGVLAFVILPLFWGVLIGYALIGISLLFGAVLRTLLVAIDPESRSIKQMARQMATEGARSTSASGNGPSQPSSESITTLSRQVKIKREEQEAVSSVKGDI
jgi:hypothetical protein